MWASFFSVKVYDSWIRQNPQLSLQILENPTSLSLVTCPRPKSLMVKNVYSGIQVVHSGGSDIYRPVWWTGETFKVSQIAQVLLAKRIRTQDGSDTLPGDPFPIPGRW